MKANGVVVLNVLREADKRFGRVNLNDEAAVSARAAWVKKRVQQLEAAPVKRDTKARAAGDFERVD